MKHFEHTELLLAAVSLSSLIASCTRDITLDTEGKPEVVVECVLKPKTTSPVFVINKRGVVQRVSAY